MLNTNRGNNDEDDLPQNWRDISPQKVTLDKKQKRLEDKTGDLFTAIYDHAKTTT